MRIFNVKIAKRLVQNHKKIIPCLYFGTPCFTIVYKIHDSICLQFEISINAILVWLLVLNSI